MRLFATVLLSLGLITSAAAADPVVIRIGAVGSGTGKPYGTGLVSVAQAKGFFDQEFAKDGIKVQITYYANTGPAINEALAQGEEDFGEYGGLPNVIGLDGGVPAHVVAARHSGGDYYLLTHPAGSKDAINSVKDLKGKRIAVQMGTLPHLMLLRLLKAEGYGEHDVQVVNIPNAEAPGAFEAGAIDALWSTPALLALRDAHSAQVIASTKELPWSDTSLGGFLVADKFAAAHPDLVERLLKAYALTAAWASKPENKTELLTIYAQSGLPLKYYQEEYSGDLHDDFSVLIDPAAVHGYSQTLQFALDRRLVRRQGDPASWIDGHYLTQALKETGLENFWTPRQATP